MEEMGAGMTKSCCLNGKNGMGVIKRTLCCYLNGGNGDGGSEDKELLFERQRWG